MKSLKHICAFVLTVLSFASCTEKEDTVTSGKDDEYYASKAVVSSTDTRFAASDEGGTISFAAEGGSVNVAVDCGTDWIVENNSTDLFQTTVNNIVSFTINAVQNVVTQDLSAYVRLYTASSHICFATISIIQSAYNKPEISVGTASWHAPAVGELTADIEVISNIDDWTAESSASWVTVEKTDVGVRLSAEENAETEERDAAVTIALSDGITSDFVTISVVQDARAYVTPDKVTAGLYEKGEHSSIKVDSNYDWDYSYDSSNGWLTVSRDGDVLTVSVTEDFDEEGGSRQAVITLTVGDGAMNTVESVITVTEFGP